MMKSVCDNSVLHSTGIRYSRSSLSPRWVLVLMLLACATGRFPSNNVTWAQIVTKSAEKSPLFRFSDVQNMSDDRAQQYVEAHIRNMLVSGDGTATDLVKSIAEAGAKCQLLRDFHNKYWCTYESAAPGLAGRYISRQLQVVIDFDDSTKVTSVLVAVGRTGP
jgi:hypothetical protein